MTQITNEQIQILIEAECLSVHEITPSDRSRFIDPRSLKDGTWREQTLTRVKATLCGEDIEARFDPNEIGSQSNMLDKLIAESSGKPAPGPKPSEEEVVQSTLAKLITNRLPDMSNHAKLRIYNALGITGEQ